MAKKVKHSYEYIFNFYAEQGCVLLNKEYLGNKYQMKYICKCGEESETSFQSFRKSKCCKKCGFKKISNKKRRCISDIRKIYENQGCKLLEEEYISQSTPMTYKCVCGKTYQKSLSAFQLCPNCDECISNNYKEILLTPYDEVKSFFADKGCALLNTEYKGIFEPLDYICSCGRADVKTFTAFKACSECPKCWIKKRTGENNFRWNPNLTDEEREANKSRASLPEQKKWKLAVYKRDNYLCQCCGKRSTRSNPINAHHLDGYNWCIERRTDVTNGVTLCQDCHTDFHSEFGYGDNTEAQYNDWINNKRNQDAI